MLALLLVLAAAQFDCSYTSTTGSYNLSPAISSTGAYISTGNLNGTAVTFYVQVCQNVSPIPAACKAVEPSPVYAVTSSGTCLSLGSITAAAWDMNPSGNGVRLTMYHGR
jgi:hypothetical protein